MESKQSVFAHDIGKTKKYIAGISVFNIGPDKANYLNITRTLTIHSCYRKANIVNIISCWSKIILNLRETPRLTISLYIKQAFKLVTLASYEILGSILTFNTSSVIWILSSSWRYFLIYIVYEESSK